MGTPTIGTLFLLKFISATAIGLILLAPLERILRRFSRITLQLSALSGFGITATSLVALLVSEHTKLFGFMESNYRPAIIVAIASEASAAVILLLVFVANWSAKRPVSRPKARWRITPSQALARHSGGTSHQQRDDRVDVAAGTERGDGFRHRYR